MDRPKVREITTLSPRAMKQMAKQGVGHSKLEEFAKEVRKNNKKKNKK